ncbi:MAG TPA: glycosyltransferase, partial [Chloroflexia bacterium]|nr:glycosyltransferase [Chloroflexia bacterium]
MSHPPDYSPPGTPEPVPQPFDIEAPRHESATEKQALPVGAPTVSVVVLNFNGLRHLEPCFTSLLELDYPKDRLELMLVDNASSDGSVDFM